METTLRNNTGMHYWSHGIKYIDNRSGILYTEDNIPIQTVYVGNISSEATEKDLKEYFERFGNLVSIIIKRRGTPDEPYFYALVTFREPQSAKRVLIIHIHRILDRFSKVKAADSWNQPRKDEFYRNSSEIDSSKDEDNQFSILNLNDDCWFHIASFLELSDLVNLSKTCKRLQCAANAMFASYKSLDTRLFENLTLMTIRAILAKIGPNLQQITCCTLNERIKKRFIQFIPKYCSKVKLLELTFTKISAGDYVYKNIIRTFKNLKTLKLQKCSITDDVCAVIHNCADLETLDLSENREITGRHLDKLGNLKTLNLKCCPKLEPKFFNALCMQTKLVSLNIENCDSLYHSEVFETLANTQIKLEDLSILDQNYVSSILLPLTRLKNLKRLTMRGVFFVNCDFFQELAKYRGAELEMLKITRIILSENAKQALCELKNLKELSLCRCSEIDSSFLTRMAKSTPLEYFSSVKCCSVRNEGILNLIRFSDTIKKINVSLCEQIAYRGLITSAVEILKTKHINEPLTLIVGENDISPDIMDDPIVLNNRHLIDLEFGLTRALMMSFVE